MLYELQIFLVVLEFLLNFSVLSHISGSKFPQTKFFFVKFLQGFFLLSYCFHFAPMEGNFCPNYNQTMEHYLRRWRNMLLKKRPHLYFNPGSTCSFLFVFAWPIVV